MTVEEVKNTVRETVDKILEKLPCKRIQTLVHEHDVILNNGLRDAVKLLREDMMNFEIVLKEHTKEHQDYLKEKRNDRRLIIISIIGWTIAIGGVLISLIK